MVDEEGERKEKGEEGAEGQATLTLLTKDTNKVRVLPIECRLLASTIPNSRQGNSVSQHPVVQNRLLEFCMPGIQS